MKTLVVIVAVFAILRIASALLVLSQLLRTRLWRTRLLVARDEEVVASVREGLRPLIAELEALEFELLGWVALERQRPEGETPRFHAWLVHRAARAYADAAFSVSPDPLVPWVVDFTTYGVDGRVLRTLGVPESFLGEPPGTLVVTPDATTVAQQWQVHREAARARALVPAIAGDEAALALARDGRLAAFDSLVRDGDLAPAGDGSYRMSWPLALRACRRTLSSTSRLRALRARRGQALGGSAPPVALVPLEEEVAAYEHHLEVTGRPRPSFLASVFVITLVAFSAAGAYSSGAATTSALVLAIVLFHECGHYLAMRALGYIDATIFFVPFLGGVAAGRKDDATVAQRMIVLLSGPIPGLLLAGALAVATPVATPVYLDGLQLLAIINLFNLLPILPLDGGQIAHMLFFARRPWLDVASRATAGVGLVVLGWEASAVFLAVLGAITLLELPRSRRHAVLRRRFEQARATSPDESPLRLFFRVLREGSLAALPFEQKVVLARATLARSQVAPMRLAAKFGWASAYAATVLAGCAALILVEGAAIAGRAASPRASVPAPRASLLPVAPLVCPAQPPSEEEETGQPAPPGTYFAGLGTFDGLRALEEGRTRVRADVPGAVFRVLDRALFVWARGHFDGDGDFIEESPGAAEGVRAAISAAGGAPHDGAAFDCRLPEDADAAR
jgi:Zn-dependent protease